MLKATLSKGLNEEVNMNYTISLSRTLRIFSVVLLVMSISAFAQESLPQNSELSAYQMENEHISKSISELTGIALNPMLIGATLGAYKYYKMDDEARMNAPWYLSPWFLILCFCLAGLSFLISTPSLLANLPPQLSSFLEMNNKQIGLLLNAPLIFSIIGTISEPIAVDVHAMLTNNQEYLCASIIPLNLLSGIPLIIWNIIVMVSLFFVFIAIWLLNLTFDVITFLCPFGFVKSFLATARGSIYSALAALSAAYPPLALIVTLPIIIISLIFFGWSIRRFVMGIVFMWDFIRIRKEVPIDEKGIVVFSGSSLNMPSKRMGRLTENNGMWVFTYRKYFLFRKTVVIKKSEPLLKKGFFYSSIYEKGNHIYILSLRYQKIIEHLQTYLNIEKFENSKLKKGIKATVAWIKDAFHKTNSTLSVVYLNENITSKVKMVAKKGLEVAMKDYDGDTDWDFD